MKKTTTFVISVAVFAVMIAAILGYWSMEPVRGTSPPRPRALSTRAVVSSKLDNVTTPAGRRPADVNPEGTDPAQAKSPDKSIAELPNKRAQVLTVAIPVKASIDRLKSETVEQSLANADFTTDFFWPGYSSGSFLKHPTDDVHTLLSNSRTMKLYAELKEVTPEARSALLHRHFSAFATQYRDLLSQFRGKTQEETAVLLGWRRM